MQNDAAARKQELRRLVIAARLSRSGADRAAAQAANVEHLFERLCRARVVCAYLPLATEPLSTALLDRLHGADVGVLVPVASSDAPLDWTTYPTATVVGAFGIAEPSGPRLGAVAVRTADVIVVPALAVDESGHRLGRGGGHYDRSLALLAGPPLPAGPLPSRELIAVLFDGEMVPELPAAAHDVRVTAVVTPTAGLVRLRS